MSLVTLYILYCIHHRTLLHYNPFYSGIYSKQAITQVDMLHLIAKTHRERESTTDLHMHRPSHTYSVQHICTFCHLEESAKARTLQVCVRQMHNWSSVVCSRPTYVCNAATTQVLMSACPTRAAAFWAIVCCSLSISSLSRCMRASSECRRTISCFTAQPHVRRYKRAWHYTKHLSRTHPQQNEKC